MGDQWIPSIAQLIPRTLGTPTRRSGAAAFTTSAALSPSFCQLLCPSRQRHPPILTTVPMVSPIGKQAGLWPRRLGAAAMKARAAHQQLVGALRGRVAHLIARSTCEFILIGAALAFVPSSGAHHQFSEGSDRRVE